MIVIAKPKRSAASSWLDRVNPLQGLSTQQAKNIFDIARAHGSPLLQKIYDEIELTDPVLMTCVERRQSALAGLGWRVVANASAKDQGLAEEQRAAIEEFACGIENLDDAIEHLDLAFFRGFSVCQPVWESGRVRTVNILNSWNFLRGDDGRLVWNPDCSLDIKSCIEITPAARTVQLVRRRAIDWPALTIYIRKYVGERDWGRCLERYGVPPVDAVMGPNATTEQRDEYLECAEAAKEGRVVVWPSGTTASRAEGIRGQDPFTAFIEHQEKLIVLMSTGGTLTSLAQADTGALAGGAQMDVWSQIVQRDGVVISGALNRGLFNRFLADAFPGRPLAAHFEIGMEEEPSAAEAAELAGKISVAGFTVDKSQLEEKTGFKLEAKPESAPQPGAPLFNKAVDAESSPRKAVDAESSPRKAVDAESSPRKAVDAESSPRDPGKTPEKELTPKTDQASEPQAGALLKAFAKDTGPAAEAVKRLLENPTPEAAGRLLDDLPALLPDDPELATVIAEAMAAEFADVAKNKGEITTPREYKREKDGKFAEVDHPRDFKPGKNPDSAATQAAEIGKGKKAIEKCLAEKCDVFNAISRGDVGMISLVYSTGGDNPRGLVRFLERPEAKAHLAETLVRGEAVGPYQHGQKLNLKHGGYVATLRLTGDEKAGYPRNWVLSGYGPNDKKEGAE